MYPVASHHSRRTEHRSRELHKKFIEFDIPWYETAYDDFVQWKGNCPTKGFQIVEKLIDKYVRDLFSKQPTEMVTINIEKDGCPKRTISYNIKRGIKSLIEQLSDYKENEYFLCREFDEKNNDIDEFTLVENGETIYMKNHNYRERFMGRYCSEDFYSYTFIIDSEKITLEYHIDEKTFLLINEDDDHLSAKHISLTKCLESNTKGWSRDRIWNIIRLYHSHCYLY
jgi:hypothetical protein